MHSFRSEWPFIIIIIVMHLRKRGAGRGTTGVRDNMGEPIGGSHESFFARFVPDWQS